MMQEIASPAEIGLLTICRTALKPVGLVVDRL